MFAGGVTGDADNGTVSNNIDVFWLDDNNVLHKISNVPTM